MVWFLQVLLLDVISGSSGDNKEDITQEITTHLWTLNLSTLLLWLLSRTPHSPLMKRGEGLFLSLLTSYSCLAWLIESIFPFNVRRDMAVLLL